MFPSGFSVSAFDADGAIIIQIIDGPGFRTDDDGEWGGRVALQAFNEALQFLNAG